MRTYPTDSPQAAARLLALTLIADGQLQASETAALLRFRAHDRLGLSAEAFHDVIHGACEDLLADASARGDDRCQLDPETLERLFDEIQQPALRRKVLRLIMRSIDADGRLHEGEMRLLLAAIDHWNLRPDGLEDLMIPPAVPTRMRSAPDAGAALR